MGEASLHKTNTGIASEFFVAGELARRGYNVTLTLGNTKAIDLLIEQRGSLIPVQVKGMQRTESGNWNVNLEKLTNMSILFVLVNLHAETLQQPEYFVLTAAEVKQHFKFSGGRDYLSYSAAVALNFKDAWHKIEAAKAAAIVNEDITPATHETFSSMYWTGYCPESALQGKQVRMRLNKDDFYESEATGLQIAVLTGVQAIIMNFRGNGKFRSTEKFADEIENGELLSPQTSDRPPFNYGKHFQESTELNNFINRVLS